MPSESDNTNPAPQATPHGEPASLPPTWCRNCEAEVKPQGKGQCPRCGRMLRLNFVRRKHAVNKLRKQQLLETFVQEYRPTTQRLRSMCEQFADVTEQLETTAAGSTEHQRLLLESQTLGAALEASRPALDDHADVEELDVDGLITEATRMLRLLLEMRDSERTTTAPAFDSPPIVERDVVVERSPTPAAEPAPRCGFCERPAEGCAAMKVDRPEVWSILHYDHPDEVERRRNEATAEMMRPGAGRLPDWYR